MTSYGSDIFAKTLNATDIRSTGKIFWKDFVPPLENAGVNTISAVLESGNDANGEEIQNCGGISISTDGVRRNPDPGHITGATEINCNTLRATESFIVNANCITLDFDEDASGTTIQGSTQAGDPTACTHLDFSSSTNTFGDINMNGGLLSNAASVGALDVIVENRVVYTPKIGTTFVGSSLTGHPTLFSNCNFRDGSNNTFPDAEYGDLAQTMALGNKVSDDLNMQDAANTKRDILNADAVGCTTLTAITSVNAPIIVGSTSVSTETFAGIDLNLNALSVAHANLKFTATDYAKFKWSMKRSLV